MAKIKFVESKTPDHNRVQALLDRCASENQWANRGPLYWHLADAFRTHFSLPDDQIVVPCSNGGVALEAMARLKAQDAGRPLRWIGSSFSFRNLGRGYFADMAVMDCTASGLLDLEAVRALDVDSFDGIVIVNPFGVFEDFSAYFDFARAHDKHLIIDNAAGVGPKVPDWPWQSFSLHHTKPYGFGEGGLAIVPAAAQDGFYELLDYGAVPRDPGAWLNNGKISDVSCAYLIDRLEQVDAWAPAYLEQAERIVGLALRAGFTPLKPEVGVTPAMSWPMRSHTPVSMETVMAADTVTFGKYYAPLAQTPGAVQLYDHLFNVPCHPDLGQLTDADIVAAMEALRG